ncbi:MAG: hypothetical protein COA65_08515 [Rhodospirillaceae bacterium]|nr:MAG: hypothetical protein COA65_08515 [Rhodospirillaceae bacterium]
MFLAIFLDQIAIVTFLALLIWAAVGDYYRYLIPNALSVAAALLFFVHVFAAAAPVDWVGGLITGGTVFFVGATMFAFRLLGGGDVKLLSAVALWAGPAQIIDVLLITGLAGGLLSLAMMTTFYLYRPGPAEISVSVPRVSRGKQYIPYGIAIAAGGFYVGARLLTE